MSSGPIVWIDQVERCDVGTLGPFPLRYAVRTSPTPRLASGAEIEWDLTLAVDIDLASILPAPEPSDCDVQNHRPTVVLAIALRDTLRARHEIGPLSASLLAALTVSLTDAMLDVPFGKTHLAAALHEMLTRVGLDGARAFLEMVFEPYLHRSRAVETEDIKMGRTLSLSSSTHSFGTVNAVTQ